MGQPITDVTDPISGPSFDFTFTLGPELDNSKVQITPFTLSFSVNIQLNFSIRSNTHDQGAGDHV